MTYDSTAPYPRDLIGYGRNTPKPEWPGKARVAVRRETFEDLLRNDVLSD